MLLRTLGVSAVTVTFAFTVSFFLTRFGVKCIVNMLRQLMLLMQFKFQTSSIITENEVNKF